MTTILLKITGMTCGHCTQAVSRAVAAVAGVTAVQVSLERQEASVQGDADLAKIIGAVADAGYAARLAST